MTDRTHADKAQPSEDRSAAESAETVIHKNGDGDPNATISEPPPPTKRHTKPGSWEGKRIGGYEMKGVLGKGAMGVVYKAIQVSLGRPVAIKRMMPEYAGLTRREARTLAELKHHNIVGVHEITEDGETVFMVMEFVEGKPLDEGKYQGRSKKWIARTILQILTGLSFAHERGVLHCDLKPANVMIDEATHQAKLMDFGLAQKRTDIDTENAYGTPGYMAPEYLRGIMGEGGDAVLEHNIQTEVYAVGGIMAYLVSGKGINPGSKIQEILSEIDTCDDAICNEIAACRDLAREDPHLGAILRMATQKHARNRYQDTLAFMSDLRAYLDGRHGEIEAMNKHGDRQGSKGALLVLALIVLLAVGGLMWENYKKRLALEEQLSSATSREESSTSTSTSTTNVTPRPEQRPRQTPTPPRDTPRSTPSPIQTETVSQPSEVADVNSTSRQPTSRPSSRPATQVTEEDERVARLRSRALEAREAGNFEEAIRILQQLLTRSSSDQDRELLAATQAAQQRQREEAERRRRQQERVQRERTQARSQFDTLLARLRQEIIARNFTQATATFRELDTLANSREELQIPNRAILLDQAEGVINFTFQTNPSGVNFSLGKIDQNMAISGWVVRGQRTLQATEGIAGVSSSSPTARVRDPGHYLLRFTHGGRTHSLEVLINHQTTPSMTIQVPLGQIPAGYRYIPEGTCRDLAGNIVSVPHFLMAENPVEISEYLRGIAAVTQRLGNPIWCHSSEPRLKHTHTLHATNRVQLGSTADYMDPQGREARNHFPAAGMNWFSAYSYAQWKTSELRTANTIQATWHCELPSYEQMQRAIQGLQLRPYPRGQAADTSLYNISGSQVQLTYNGNTLTRSRLLPTGTSGTTYVLPVTALSPSASIYGINGLVGNTNAWLRLTNLPNQNLAPAYFGGFITDRLTLNQTGTLSPATAASLEAVPSRTLVGIRLVIELR